MFRKKAKFDRNGVYNLSESIERGGPLSDEAIEEAVNSLRQIGKSQTSGMFIVVEVGHSEEHDCAVIKGHARIHQMNNKQVLESWLSAIPMSSFEIMSYLLQRVIK